jgi:hypothetical protein
MSYLSLILGPVSPAGLFYFIDQEKIQKGK